MTNKIIAAESLQIGSTTKPVTQSVITKVITSNISCTENATTSPYIKFVDNSWYISNDGVKIVNIGSGVAPSADKLTTARTINGTSFDGTANITITAAANGGTCEQCTGNALTASTLKTPISVSITGDASASVASFNGSSNLILNTTIATASTTAKGLTILAAPADVTAASSVSKAVTPYSLAKAQANGVASLDSRSKLTASQMPITISTLEPSTSDGANGDIWLVIKE